MTRSVSSPGEIGVAVIAMSARMAARTGTGPPPPSSLMLSGAPSRTPAARA